MHVCIYSLTGLPTALETLLKLGIWVTLVLKGTHIMRTLFLGFGVLFWVSGAPTHIQTLKKVCT